MNSEDLNLPRPRRDRRDHLTEKTVVDEGRRARSSTATYAEDRAARYLKVGTPDTSGGLL